jgi:LytS/YehU family sensor histidine kinase
MRVRIILSHILPWGSWISLLIFAYSINNRLFFWDQFFFHGVNIVVFYFFWGYIMPNLSKQKSKSWIAIRVVALLFVFYTIKYITDYKYVNYFDYPHASRVFTIEILIRDVSPVFLSNAIMGIVAFYVKEYFIKQRKLITAEKEKVELLEANFKLEQEKFSIQQTNLLLEKKQIETENAYLRAQINPHFLHNTLNFFFSKSLNAGAPDLAEAIMVLSDVMRFSLEAKPDENGRVVAAKELEHFNNVIKINEIRFSKKYVIDYKVEGDMEKVKIIPLVLITMVENAFKYGELFDPQNPLQIHISAVNNRFRFHLRNKKRTGGTPEPSHGIGVANSIQRLRAAYGEDGYSITIEQDEVFYAVTFVINDTTYVAPAVLSEATSKYESELATSTN